MKLIDGASLVHSLRLDRSIKRYRDYAEKKVIPFIEEHLATTKHVAIWDQYLSDSQKTDNQTVQRSKSATAIT